MTISASANVKTRVISFVMGEREWTVIGSIELGRECIPKPISPLQPIPFPRPIEDP